LLPDAPVTSQGKLWKVYLDLVSLFLRLCRMCA
jgi:hypothetical protein